jgi:hypothetical protein
MKAREREARGYHMRLGCARKRWARVQKVGTRAKGGHACKRWARVRAVCRVRGVRRTSLIRRRRLARHRHGCP